MARLLLFTGMNREARIYKQQLRAIPDAAVVPWLDPLPGESLGDYAQRMADSLPPRAVGAGRFLAGTSFGGMVACEIACRSAVDGCFLISSVRSPAEFPPWFQLLRAGPPISGELLARISLSGSSALTDSTSGRHRPADPWHCWATSALLGWRPHPGIADLRIAALHGAKDRTFPIAHVHPDVVIADGGHVLPVTHHREVTEFLLRGMERWGDTGNKGS